jgi:hypothetical protein
MGGMPLDEAILCLRADPSWAKLVEDAYLGRDVASEPRPSPHAVDVKVFVGTTEFDKTINAKIAACETTGG